MSTVRTAPPRAWSTWRIIGVTAVVGLAVGVGLSLRQEAQFDEEIEAMQRRAEQVDLPLPDPVPAITSDPFAPDPKLLAALPPFPGAHPRDLFRGSAIQGVPMSIAWFATVEPVESVLTYYDTFYKEQELDHQTHRYGPNSGYVAWLEEPEDDEDAGPGEGLLHMISAVRQGQETLVFLSETNPLAILSANTPQLPPGVVLPDGARRPRIFDLGESMGSTLSIHSRVEAAELQTIRGFYQAHFARGGWVVATSDPVGDTWSLTAMRNHERQVVSLVQRTGGVDLVITFSPMAGTE